MANTVEITVTEIEGESVTFSNLPRVLREKYGVEIFGMHFSEDGNSVKAEGKMALTNTVGIVETYAQYKPLGRVIEVTYEEIKPLF